MKKYDTKYYLLLLLALVFAAPGIAAYFFYQHPHILNAAKTNKGLLLEQPIALSSLGNQAKWRMVFWQAGPCEQQCVQRLDLLARVRLALGRKLYQVQQWLMLDDPASLSEELKKQLKERDFHVGSWSVDDRKKLDALPAAAFVFLVNPEQYLILTYPTSFNPDDLYKDLKHLLNTESKSD